MTAKSQTAPHPAIHAAVADARNSSIHAAHEAHRYHQYGEAIKKGIETVSLVVDTGKHAAQAGEALHAARAAELHLRKAGQVFYDLQRVAATKAIFESLAARSADRSVALTLRHLQTAALQLRERAHVHRSMVHGYHSIQREYGLLNKINVGKYTLAVEHWMAQSATGRVLLKTGKIAADERVMNGLTYAGSALDVFLAYQESKAETTRGKAMAGVLTAAAGVAVGKTPIGSVIAAADFAGKAVGHEELSVGNFYHGTMEALSGIAETALFKHDSNALSRVHADNMAGKHSVILQCCARMGEAISKTAVVDSSLARLADWQAGVPKDLRTSIVWWGSH